MNRDDLSTVAAYVQEVAARFPIAMDGVVIGGSYDPKDGTVQVIIGDTYAIFGDTADQAIPHPRVPLLVTQLGDQYGPVGNERCVLMHTQSGLAALLVHGQDDTPGAPAGERWIGHRNAAGVTNASIKLTNDGAVVGDGLGGVQINGGSAVTIKTNGGLEILYSDALGYMELGGLLLDPNQDAVVTVRYLTAALVALTTHVQTALNTLAAATQSGPGIAAPTIAATAVVGSAGVKAKA